MLQEKQEINQTYIILEEIGSGGGGTVYKAYHKNLEKTVVLKRIHTNLMGSNVRAEVDILKNLKSPYLPQVFDFIQQDGAIYTVMDYIPGKSFKEVLQEKKSFTQRQVLKWLDQLCQAVEQLHTQDKPIIHGDIKPANIMLTPKDDICLIDFNISGDFQESDIMGFTPGYAAPEQMKSVKARIAYNKARNQQSLSNSIGKTDGKEETKTLSLNLDENTLKGTVTAVANDTEETKTLSLNLDGNGLDGTVTTIENSAEETRTLLQSTSNEITATSNEVTESLSASQPGLGEREEPDLSGKEPPRIQVDVRSDIYSIGATMYHLISGQCPDAENVRQITELVDKIEDSFAFIIMKCLEQNPENRYQSVQELHKAVLNVHKSSRIYRRLLRNQLSIRILLIAGMIGFAALAGFGRITMKQEEMDQYEGLVSLIEESRQNLAYQEAEEYYRQAVAIYPDGAGAAMEMTETLYQQKRYQDTIDFVQQSVIGIVTDTQFLGEIYYLYGNSYLELEKYGEAEEAFQEAFGCGLLNPEIYRDDAIALARLGNAKEAAQQLERAVAYQLASDNVYYVQGEICYSQEDWEGAASAFQSCIAGTNDDYMKMRAYLMCNEALKNEAEDPKERCAFLEEAHSVLPTEYQNGILEELAKTYMELSSYLEDAQYDLKAVQVFQEIINNGWGIYTTYHNIAVLYQKNQMYEEEKVILEEMLDLFGENYNTYKRLAFMEAGAQMLLENEERDFHAFDEYYQKAVSLYEEQLANNQNDLEMESLQNLYQQAVDGGWIEDPNVSE